MSRIHSKNSKIIVKESKVNKTSENRKNSSDDKKAINISENSQKPSNLLKMHKNLQSSHQPRRKKIETLRNAPKQSKYSEIATIVMLCWSEGRKDTNFRIKAKNDEKS